MPSVEQLITNGGAIGILAAIVLAFYSGRVTTKGASDDRVTVVTKMWSDRFADERAEKEAWKAQAQALTPMLTTIADELEEANKRDEDWKRELFSRVEGGLERRRQ